MVSLGRIAKNNHLIYTFVYTVKNTQANVVKVKVMEQIPTSSDEKLKVSSLLVEITLSLTHFPFSSPLGCCSTTRIKETKSPSPIPLRLLPPERGQQC